MCMRVGTLYSFLQRLQQVPEAWTFARNFSVRKRLRPYLWVFAHAYFEGDSQGGRGLFAIFANSAVFSRTGPEAWDTCQGHHLQGGQRLWAYFEVDHRGGHGLFVIFAYSAVFSGTGGLEHLPG